MTNDLTKLKNVSRGLGSNGTIRHAKVFSFLNSLARSGSAHARNVVLARSAGTNALQGF